MKIRSYEEAVKYLEGFIGKIRFEITPESLKHHDPLERMRVLLNLLGNPQNKFQSVLVGGTAGKGSTAYLISHILTTAGYKTGLTISPHLQKITERIQINGQSVSDEKFLGIVSSVVRYFELMKKIDVGAPSYFEVIVAMAFLYFAKQKVDIAVVEVGMGGEFDATNTLSPLVAVLTNVSLDHTNILGGTVQKIARTKAGIIKGLRIKDKGLRKIHHSSLIINHSVVVTGVQQQSVIKIVEEKCREADAKLYRLHKDFDFKIKKESLEGSVFDLTINSDRVLKLNDLKILLLGRYQVENASLAVSAVLQLRKFGFQVSEEDIRTALKTAFFPGRFEVVNSQLILDGAHNPTKMRAFLSTLKKLFPKEKKIFIIAFKSDKNIKGMLREILKIADILIVTEFRTKTDMSLNASAETESIKHEVSGMKYKSVSVEKDSKKAVEKALAIQQFNNSTIIIVTGSLYLVGEVRNML